MNDCNVRLEYSKMLLLVNGVINAEKKRDAGRVIYKYDERTR